MGGMITSEKFAILDGSCPGISVETFDSLEKLLWATAYKFCSQRKGDTTAFEKLSAEVIAEAKHDWIGWKSIEEANAAGVFSGMLENGDTFGDEDDGPEGGETIIELGPDSNEDSESLAGPIREGRDG